MGQQAAKGSYFALRIEGLCLEDGENLLYYVDPSSCCREGSVFCSLQSVAFRSSSHCLYIDGKLGVFNTLCMCMEGLPYCVYMYIYRCVRIGICAILMNRRFTDHFAYVFTCQTLTCMCLELLCIYQPWKAKKSSKYLTKKDGQIAYADTWIYRQKVSL